MLSNKILVVDDEEVVISFLSELLEEKGFQVLKAQNAYIAQEIIRNDKECRMVLCDIKMPDMDGLELLDVLRKERPHLIVLMMTAYASWETVTAAIQKGAYDYIRKPFSIEDILNSIENAWKRYCLETENSRLRTLFSLFKISKLIKGHIDVYEMCQGLVEFVLDNVDADKSAVVFFKNKENDIEKIIAGGQAFDWNSFLSSKPLSKKKKLYVSDKSKDLLPKDSQDVIVTEDQTILGMEMSVLCIPLEHNDIFIGFLLIGKDFNKNIPFTRGDLEFVNIVSEQVGASLVNRRLYLLLENKIKELEEANKKLEETKLHLIQNAKLASVGELSAGIAHEVGNPIFSIRGTAELLLSRKERYGLSEELIESIEIIRKQAARAQDVANSLMTFAQKKDFQPERLEINSVIKDTLKLMKALFYKKNIEVEMFLQEDSLTVYCDRGQISQAVFNIMINAYDAMNNEGGKVQISTFKKGDDVFIKISDDGPGIFKENINKIFFPFFTTKDVDKGHGLGLSITYGIVEKHGGRISVKSIPEKETVFTVILPVYNKSGITDEGEDHGIHK